MVEHDDDGGGDVPLTNLLVEDVISDQSQTTRSSPTLVLTSLPPVAGDVSSVWYCLHLVRSQGTVRKSWKKISSSLL